MPIGVPRIIYSWGAELPAQWTDIYNFVFRRRMVFLMQYLDDDLCNQICGLLINIHMDDREQELDTKQPYSTSSTSSTKSSTNIPYSGKASKVQNLLKSEEDLDIDKNYMLEQYTLQKITTEWLNWNAQFFDYSNQPYVYYLAEILSKDFDKDNANLLYNTDRTKIAKLMKMFKKMTTNSKKSAPMLDGRSQETQFSNHFDVYSGPFRLLANFASQDYSLRNTNPLKANQKGILKEFTSYQASQKGNNSVLSKLLNDLSNEQFSKHIQTHEKQTESAEKALGQRRLKRAYAQDKVAKKNTSQNALNYLDFNSYATKSPEESYNEYKEYYRKQAEQSLIEEESKKIFVMINSFGGSVGNGITVHDALQFIKAGSFTLGLGVAASASSLVLAGGTIGERYVTEACHVMIHQPEGGVNGQASDILIDSQEIMKIRLDVAEIYSLSTYRPRHKILRDLDRDFYLTAPQTVYYGLADEIATSGVMHNVIEMINKAWNYDDISQESLLQNRVNVAKGGDVPPDV